MWLCSSKVIERLRTTSTSTTASAPRTRAAAMPAARGEPSSRAKRGSSTMPECCRLKAAPVERGPSRAGGPPARPPPEAAQHRAQLARFHRRAVAEGDHLVRHGREARAGHEDADQVERIRGGPPPGLRLLRAPPHRAQRLHRLGERELLADQSGDEAPAADLAARLERAERAQDDAPRRHARLARHELAHDHTPAAEKLAGE